MDITAADAIILTALAVFAFEGYRRGLIREVTDLAGLGVGVIVGLAGYLQLGAWLSVSYKLPGSMTDVVSFFALFIISTSIFAFVIGLVLRPLIDGIAGGPLGIVNFLGGISFGVAKGLIFVAVFLRALTVLPLPPIQVAISDSTVARAINDGFGVVVPYAEDAFSRMRESASLAVPMSAGEESRDLAIPSGITVWVDPDSEEVMLKLLNQERVLGGLPALVADSRLRDVARAHSEEMLRLSYFAHDSPVSGSPFSRLRAAGIRYGTAGENLAYAPTVEVAHRGLMNSTEHRRNILLPEFRRVGIGVMRSGFWGRAFTQDFAD